MGRKSNLDLYREAKDIVEFLTKHNSFNWQKGNSPIITEMVARLNELRSKLEDSDLRVKLDILIKRENLSKFDIGVDMINK